MNRKQRRSAGLLLFRKVAGRADALEVLLVHPGGPFWKNKDLGAWSLPKGEYPPTEDPLAAAKREFHEETGSPAVEGVFLPLGEVRQASGKIVTAWAVEGDFDPATLVSNTVHIEWPPRSGAKLEIPEVDRAAWFTIDDARAKMNPAQQAFLDRLREALAA
jgi:predicted NUDIX family NTP pyrophosphohydrolase